MIGRILLADDHQIVAEGLRALLEQEPQLEVVGAVTDGKQAVRIAREREPDLVLMDLSMPEMGGIEATRRITSERPATKVLCLSMHTDRGFVMGALEAGASGYLLKQGAKEELLSAIQSVMMGQVYLSPAIAGAVVETARARIAADVSPALAPLTERERELLGLLAQGETPKEIACRLHVSAKTVYTHRTHIMEKLNIRSNAALTRFAIREGLISATE